MTFQMDENVVNRIQENDERSGVRESIHNNSSPLRVAVSESLRECDLFESDVEEIRETCMCYEIHISGVLYSEVRAKIKQLVSQKTGIHESAMKIIAFYN